jgi:enterochelin esterase-like enzyme
MYRPVSEIIAGWVKDVPSRQHSHMRGNHDKGTDVRYYLMAIRTLVLRAGLFMILPLFCTDFAFAEMRGNKFIRLKAGQAVVLPVDQTEGSYVHGTISASAPVNLSLKHTDGHTVRRLVDHVKGQRAFHFVVESEMHGLVLDNPGSENSYIDLQFSRVISKQDQIDVSEPYLSPEIASLAAHLAAGGDTSAFWAQRQSEGTPLIEPSKRSGHVIATFLWRGAQRNVRLWGAPAPDHIWLQRLGESDLWFASFELPDDTRLSYGLAPDIPQFAGTEAENRRAILATLQADPLNRHPIPPHADDLWTTRSVMELAKAPRQPGSDGPMPKNKGLIRSVEWISAVLGNSRNVDLYIPADFDGNDQKSILLYLFDGPAYQTGIAHVPEILDRLIAAHRLPPVVVAMIDPIDANHRSRELTCNPKTPQAMVSELHPLIEEILGYQFQREKVAIAGSSYGGLAASCAALSQPETFGNVIAMSGSFWWRPDPGAEVDTKGTGPLDHDAVPPSMPWMSAIWARQGSPEVRFWISAGIYETAREPSDISILSTSRHLRDTLILIGQNWVSYREYAGGHDYLIWRGALADALIALFGNAA